MLKMKVYVRDLFSKINVETNWLGVGIDRVMKSEITERLTYVGFSLFVEFVDNNKNIECDQSSLLKDATDSARMGVM